MSRQFMVFLTNGAIDSFDTSTDEKIVNGQWAGLDLQTITDLPQVDLVLEIQPRNETQTEQRRAKHAQILAGIAAEVVAKYRAA